MRRLTLLLSALLLVGCSTRSVPTPLKEVAITPQSSGMVIQLRIPEAVPGGELWLDTNVVPQGAIHGWHVGLIDGAGNSHRLGWLTEAANYQVPRDAAPGSAEVWISTGESASSPGTIRTAVTLLVAHKQYESKVMGLRFDVPKGWRLYEGADSIRLERTAERASTPIEEMRITPCPEQGCRAVEGEVLAESERWIAGRWIPFRHLRRSSAMSGTWEEMHLTFPQADLALAYRPDLQFGVQELYDRLAESLRFEGEALPEELPTACDARLAEVHPAIGPDWTVLEGRACHQSWRHPEQEIRLGLFEAPFYQRDLIEPRRISLQGESVAYPATLGQMLPRTLGVDPPKLPTSWHLRVAGARGAVELVCSGEDQATLDEFCPALLTATKIGNLGKPATSGQ